MGRILELEAKQCFLSWVSSLSATISPTPRKERQEENRAPFLREQWVTCPSVCSQELTLKFPCLYLFPTTESCFLLKNLHQSTYFTALCGTEVHFCCLRNLKCSHLRAPTCACQLWRQKGKNTGQKVSAAKLFVVLTVLQCLSPSLLSWPPYPAPLFNCLWKVRVKKQNQEITKCRQTL